MENLEYEIVQGKKLKSAILYIKSEKQLYKIKSKTNNKTYYVCYQTNCPARVELSCGVCCKPKNNIKQHNHGDVEGQCKRKCDAY